MEKIAREDKKANDLFFVCSLIEYIARKTLNERAFIVNTLGREEILKIYNLAEVYHCENIDKITFELVNKYNIPNGNYDNLSIAFYRIPTHWDIGKVLKRLILEVSLRDNLSIIDALFNVYNSFIIKKIDEYNCSMYYENTSYHYASYKKGYPL